MSLNELLPRPVLNQFPTTGAPYRLAIVGEAPGDNEVRQGKPFVGYSGNLLTDLLRDAGIVREACFIGNVCQYQPFKNDIRNFAWSGPEITSGIATLLANLAEFKPHLILCLGNTALNVAKNAPPLLTKKGTFKKWQYSITNWRGSLFWSPVWQCKCLAAFHPAALLRVYEDICPTRYDFRRARKEAAFGELQLPQRNVKIDCSLDYIVSELQRIRRDRIPISLDIEGYAENLRCLSIATTPNEIFVIPFQRMDGHSYWDEFSEQVIWRELTLTFGDPLVPKVLQNGLYDRFVLAWHPYDLLVRGITDDTMLKHWENFCEQPKDLGFQTSLYTREPFYKDGRWATDAKTFFTYNGLDSAVTLEINEVLGKTLRGSSADHYHFNIAMQDPLLFMELKGIRFDVGKREERIRQLSKECEVEQAQLEQAIGVKINVKSHQQMADLLYTKLGLPVQYKRGVRDDDGNRKQTTEYEAVLKLYLKTKDDRLMQCIKLKEKYKRISDLRSMTTDKDGRIRFSYNIVGSMTGRLSCSESPTGSGCNGQTIRSEDRDLFIADERMWMAEMDLSGADGWTVAAHCARLGDHTMLEDLRAGLKIPKILGLILKYGSVVNRWDRPTIKEKSEEINKKDRWYIALKQGQHGTNYGATPATIALQVIKESYGELFITDAQGKSIQEAYLTRYRGVTRLHEFWQGIVRNGTFICATGQKRIITGRKENLETFRSVLSHEPQANTTYVTNLAALKLWRSQTQVQLLHQVHDALLVQFPREGRDDAVNHIRQCFNNEISIAGLPITIPFDGKYGSSWGRLDGGMI